MSMQTAVRSTPPEAGRQPTLGVGVVGAGVIARVHSLALTTVRQLYPSLPLVPRLVAVTDINSTLADEVASRFAYVRVEPDWKAIVEAPDIDLVCVCLPPTLNRDAVVAAATAGKHVFCEKPLAPTVQEAREMLEACEAAGVFHALGTGYRWTPSLRAMRELIARGEIGEIRHFRGTFFLDYGSDPEVPLLWRFRKALAGGGLAADTGYHLIDTARFLVDEIESLVGMTARFIHERPLATVDVYDASRANLRSEAAKETGPVDVEDAAAALVRFANGAYGVLETSRIATGRRLAMRIEVYGSKGSLDWDLERTDEFQVCLSGDPYTFGFRRVLVNTNHPGGKELLIGVGDGTGIGWLGQQSAMWAEFLTALGEGRATSANFVDGVRANAVLDAWYASAESGVTVAVADLMSGPSSGNGG
jgi:predicted dehydrogenase